MPDTQSHTGGADLSAGPAPSALAVTLIPDDGVGAEFDDAPAYTKVQGED